MKTTLRICALALLIVAVAPASARQEASLVTRMYHIEDFCAGWQHYPAPDLGRHFTTERLVRVPHVNTFTLGGDFTVMDPGSVIDILKASTGRGEEDWESANIEERSGILFVTQTESMQQQVEERLRTLRRMFLSPVEIETMLVNIPPALLSELTQRSHILDDKSLERLKKALEEGAASVVETGKIRAYPGQRQSIWNGKKTDYTATYDREQGILQPISRPLHTGFSCEVTAFPLFETIRLDVRMSFSELNGLDPFETGADEMTDGQLSTTVTTVKEPPRAKEIEENGEKKEVFTPAKETTTTEMIDTRHSFRRPRIVLPRTTTGGITTSVMTRDRQMTYVGAFSPMPVRDGTILALFVAPTVIPNGDKVKERLGVNGHEVFRIRDVRALTESFPSILQPGDGGYEWGTLSDIDNFSSFVRDSVREGNWGDEGKSIEASECGLIVRNTAAVLDAVDREIASFGRRFLKPCRVGVKILAMTPAAFRASAPLWANGRTIKDSEARELFTTARAGKEAMVIAEADGLVMMREMALFEHLGRQSAVQGYAGGITPMIDTIDSGFSVTIRPVVHDEKEGTVTLRLRPLLTRLEGPVKTVEIEKSGRKVHEASVETFEPKFDLLTTTTGAYTVAAAATGRFVEGKPHIVLLVRADVASE